MSSFDENENHFSVFSFQKINQHIDQLRHDKTWNILKKKILTPRWWVWMTNNVVFFITSKSISPETGFSVLYAEKKKLLIMREIMNRLCALASGTFGFDESTTEDIIQLLRENPLILEQEIGSHFSILCASFWNEIRCERCKRVRNYLKFLLFVSSANYQ